MTPRFTSTARLAILAAVLLLAFPASLAESCCCSSHGTPQRNAEAENCCSKKAPATTTVSALAGDSCGCDSMTAPGSAPATEIAISSVGPTQSGLDKLHLATQASHAVVGSGHDPRVGWLESSPPNGPGLTGPASGPAPTRGPPACRS